jgi:hypothetical protein
MNKQNLRTITNNFLDVRLVSLASWPKAKEIEPRDRGGPYVVLQEGYDPHDMRMIPNEFVLGRSGKWLSIAHFYKLPIPERRAEFIFGTAAEVMQIMSDLPSKASMFGQPAGEEATAAAPANDELAAAIQSGKQQSGGTSPGKAT